jgi:transposase
MPWKECSAMDERLKFVARRLAGEAMSELCREFGISRKTGYKIFARYQHCGVQGLTDRSRRPYRYAHQLPEHPSWGARKIRERLVRRFTDIKLPAKSTIHERMHLTLKKEATKPPAANFLQQQARFDRFLEVFNRERPHEALEMKCPAEVYQPSARPYRGLPDIDYPFHDKVIVVTNCGRICLGNKKINFSTVFAGQAVGIKEVHDDIWLVSFMDYDLGYFDLDTRVLEPLDNPFGPRLSPM